MTDPLNQTPSSDTETRSVASASATAADAPTIDARKILIVAVQSIVAAALAFALFAFLFPPIYETIDDINLAMIVSGVGICDKPDAHVIWMNILVGKLLVALYSLNSKFPWYGALLCLVNVASCGLSLAVFRLEQQKSAARNVLLALSFLLSIPFIWCSPTYTSTALLAGITASLLLLCSFENRQLSGDGRITVRALAICCILVAALLRLDSSRLMLALLGAVSVFRFVRLHRAKKELFPVAASLIVMAAASEGAGFVNTAYCGPQWSNYLYLDDALNIAWDWGWLDFNENTKPIFDRIGWNHNDYQLFYSFFPIDSKVYSTENLVYLERSFPHHRYGLTPQVVWDQCRVRLTEKRLLPMILFCLLLIPLVDGTRINRFALPGVVLSILLVMCCVLKLETRVTLPLFTWLALMSLYYARADQLTGLSRNDLRARALAILLLVWATYSTTDTLRIQQRWWLRQHQELENVIASMHRNSAKLFVLNSFFPYRGMAVFENPDKYFGPFHISTGLLAPSKFGTDLLRRYTGHEELGQALMDSSTTLVGNQDFEFSLAQFISDHYHVDVHFELVEPLDILELARPVRLN